VRNIGLATLLPLTFGACSGSSTDTSTDGTSDTIPATIPASTPASPSPSDTADTLPPIPQDLLVDLQRMDEVGLPDIPPGVRYRVSLCAPDLTPTFTAADPGAALLALLDTVPTDDELQQQELATIRAGIAAGLAASDPLRSPQLLEATSLMAARCS
jgi:hypothetical protein